jgi:protein-disulfide isomerase
MNATPTNPTNPTKPANAMDQTRPTEPTDEEILAGIGRHLSWVEPLVPSPQGWIAESPAPRPLGRTSVRSRTSFAGFAPLVLVALALVVVVGAGLSMHPWLGGGPGASVEPSVTIVYQLNPPPGQAVTEADLDTTLQIFQNRLQGSGYGSATVQKIPPDRVSVTLPITDGDAVRAFLGATGKLEFVLLPAATYGSVGAPGSVAIPADGTQIDPSLPVQFTGADLDPSRTEAAEGPGTGGSWVVDFTFSAARAGEFATWTAQHVGEYFAIVLDRSILAVPFIAGPITDGKGEISGAYSEADAKRLAALLKTGALPLPVVEVSYTSSVTTVPSGAGATGAVSEATPGPIVAPTVTTPADIPSDGRTLGNANAPVTLDVWVDYQCPACRVFETENRPRLIDEYVRPGKVKIVYHDLLVIDSTTGGHESADAANAAWCAADWGKFATFQDWLWANQGTEGGGAFTLDRLLEIGRRAGLNMTTFQPCVEGGAHAADVQAESAQAAADGVSATPTVLVNGQAAASNDYDTLSAAIDRALAAASASPSATASPAILPSQSR